MAAPQDMDGYLNQILGINNAGVRNRLREKGFEDFDEIQFHSTQEVTRICDNIRKTNDGNIGNRTISVPLEENLKKLVLHTRYKYLTNRQPQYNQAPMDELDAVSLYFGQLGDDPDEDTVPAYKDNINKRIWFESIRTFLSCKKGMAGVPLLYVVREQELPPAVDPGFMQPSIDLDIETRARIDPAGGPASRYYTADNREVYQFLLRKCVGTTLGNNVRRYSRNNNGRGAYLSILSQIYGDDVKALMLNQADKKLERIYYDGRSRNYTFDTFIDQMRECFIDMGDDEWSEQRKVNKLMAAWKVPALVHLNGIVQATATYKNSFENTVVFLAGQLSHHQMKNHATPGRNVSAATTIKDSPDNSQSRGSNSPSKRELIRQLKAVQAQLKGKSGKGSGKKPPHKKNQASKFDPKNAGAYIPPHEWRKLTDEQKAAARKARAEQGIPTRSAGTVTRSAGAVNSSVRTIGEVIHESSSQPQGLTTPATLRGPGVTATPLPPSILRAPSVRTFCTTQRVQSQEKWREDRKRKQDQGQK